MSHKVKRNKLLKIGNYYYSFKLIPTVLTLIAITILTYLCIWQIGRAAEKRQLISQLERKASGIPERLSSIYNPQLLKHRFKPIIMHGTYLNQFTFLLDNQVYKKQAGYRILTAFQSPFLDKWVLVDRGWIARNSTRGQLPVIADVYGVQIIQGIINTIPTGILLKNDTYNPNTTWPIVIQALDYEFIASNLHHPVQKFVIQLQNDKQAGAYTIIEPDFGIPSDKHIGYAIQWFIFAVLVMIYYVMHSFKKDEE